MAFGDFTVTRASTKLRIGSNGLYGSVANNVPAFEFNTDGSYRGLLVEPGATNLVTYSQEFNDASWVGTVGGTGIAPVVTANDAIAPDGTMTADLIVFDRGAGNTSSDFSQLAKATFTTVIGTVYTNSIFLKAGTAGDIGKQIGLRGVLNATVTVVTLTSSWVRYSVTETETDTVGRFVIINRGTSTADNTVSVHAWQAQCETGSVATSPIVTTAGTASRVADVVSLTGASSLIGQSAGTLFVEAEYRFDNAARRLLTISDGTANEQFRITKGTDQTLLFRIDDGGVSQASIQTAGTFTGVFKLAGAYALNNVAFYVNAVQIGTDSSATIPATTRIDLGQLYDGTLTFNGWIRSVALFPTRLANATLASLTS
jgi:hypothetical protein